MKASKTVDLAALCRPVAEASLVAMAALEGADHIVRYVNPAFCVLTGKTEEGLLGLAFSGAVPGGEGFLALLDRVYGTGFPENHTESETSTSQTSCWACATWPIRAADNLIIGVMIQVTETTAFHQRTRAVNEALMIGSVRQHEMTEAADRLNEQLRWANEDLRQFAFAASHDLQEPLRMITTYSQLLVRGYLDRLGGEAAVCVDVITKGTQQMRDLLAVLLSYTEAGSLNGDGNRSVDLNLIIADVKQNLKNAIEETGTVVTCGALPAVDGHYARFIQLFQNLIANGIKYRGEVPPRIDISAEKRNDEWLFAVKDNGIGVATEYFQTIFGVFKRLHGKEIPGTGIGLAICQRVVDRYGGRIWIESQEGNGATFYFTLPVGKEGK